MDKTMRLTEALMDSFKLAIVLAAIVLIIIKLAG